jgi:hypothetical protein
MDPYHYGKPDPDPHHVDEEPNPDSYHVLKEPDTDTHHFHKGAGFGSASK